MALQQKKRIKFILKNIILMIFFFFNVCILLFCFLNYIYKIITLIVVKKIFSKQCFLRRYFHSFQFVLVFEQCVPSMSFLEKIYIGHANKDLCCVLWSIVDSHNNIKMFLKNIEIMKLLISFFVKVKWLKWSLIC